MIALEVVDRYARSIFELAEEKGLAGSLYQELAAVSKAMENRPELLSMLQSPIITQNEKCSLIEGILGSKSNALSQQFLNLLVKKNRIDLFPFITDGLRDILNGKQGIQEATVVTARELHPSILNLIQKALEGAIRKKIVLHTETNPVLIGGFQIRMGNRLIDATLRAKLNALGAQLRNVKV